MSGALTLSKFCSKKAKPHKIRGKDGRFTFNGKPFRGLKNLGPKSKHTKRYVRKFPNKTLKEISQENLKKAQAANPHTGRPPGSGCKYKLRDLVVAIKAIEAETGENLLEHFVRKGFKDNPVLKALMNKLLPDLKSVEAQIEQTEVFQLIVDVTGEESLPTPDEQKQLPELVSMPIMDATVIPKRRKVKIQRKRRY